MMSCLDSNLSDSILFLTNNLVTNMNNLVASLQSCEEIEQERRLVPWLEISMAELFLPWITNDFLGHDVCTLYLFVKKSLK